MKEELNKLSEAFASIDKKIEQIKADGYGEKQECHKEMMDNLIYAVRNISERISYLSNSFYDYQYSHSKGHLPPIKTTAQLRKALESCGMSEDYEVEVPSIYVSASYKKGIEVTASYKKK